MSDIDYAAPGPLTELRGLAEDVLPPDRDPLALCRVARGLVVQPHDAQALALPAGRFLTNHVRPAEALLRAALALDPRPLAVTRPADQRVVGTCRHFAVVTVALLRHRGVPARARCGFATYFEPGRGVDHWVVEYRRPGATSRSPWVRVDPEVLGADREGDVPVRADDLAPQDFLSGGEAWAAYRRGTLDASRFGVAGTRDAWGPAEIKGNAIRDLAALTKIEVLPWDEWGRMADAYAGRAGPDHDALVDTVAAVCGADAPAFVSDLAARDELRVPDHLMR